MPRSRIFAPLLAVTCAILMASLKWQTPWLFPLACLLAAFTVWMGRRHPWHWRFLVLVPLALCLGKMATQRSGRTAGGDDASLISALVTSEETILKLTPKLALLSEGLMTLQLPATAGESTFMRGAKASDLGPIPQGNGVKDLSLESKSWPTPQNIRAMDKVVLWRTLLDAVASFDHARFSPVDGDHPDGDRGRFEMNARFDGLARMKSGEWRSLHGTLKIGWRRELASGGNAAGEWQISRWETVSMEYGASPKRLFVEALDTAMRSPEEVAKLRRSQHYEATVKYYRGGMKPPPHPYFAPISANQKEGVAVADIDKDGFDDIYITMRIGNNIFLHNNGDGTFTDESTARGLALPGHTTCAIFADFDNDGDLDLMLGRSLLRTAYLENRGGRFFQHPSPKHFPMAVISMSAADYNGDGLLDLYLCTYRPAATAGAAPSGGVAQIDEGGFDWPDEFLSPEQAKEFRRRIAEQKQRKGGDVLFPDLFDQLGPPNVLLVNRGQGWFDVAPESATVGVWRNSLQATWGDIDQDGDPDLYIANDWAMDNFFRNDGPAGFKDISAEYGMTGYGFSMGASWGDYDNDGREDLYVSNMYSEAGRRIIDRIPGMNVMFAESASGNWLYHQESNGRFKQVGARPPSPMPVMNAGWSWGGCFADFDNDTYLDLYVLSGYFTAPKELSSDLDLESNLWRTTVRSDSNLARQSFRFSPEWKRTPPPDNLGPQIDTRLGGVDRQGEKLLVHSLNGNERNHFFSNRGGRSFVDASALSGLDNPADSRGFALLDYDRDGWQDVALVNANQPLFNLYHNEMAAAGLSGGMIAIRFVGGNNTPVASKEYSARDAYGARVTADLGDTKLIREHRCGDGWSTQNSSTMMIGIGGRSAVSLLTVKWPSGKSTRLQNIPEGTLLTLFENPKDSPTGASFVATTYRVKSRARAAVTGQGAAGE